MAQVGKGAYRQAGDILRELIKYYPKAFFEDPELVLPFDNAVRETLFEKHALEFGWQNLQRALAIYQNSRHYRMAEAAGRTAIDLDGEPTLRPALSDQDRAREWLERWPVEKCCEILRDPQLDEHRQRRVVGILQNDYRELKILAARAARNSQAQCLAFELRKKMVDVLEALTLDRPQNSRALDYARYYCAVSGCSCAQLNGDFGAAAKHADEAAKAARSFRNSERFFPNFFSNETEIATHSLYLDAVAAFRDGNFEKAAGNFERWLTLNHHLKGRGNPGFDGNSFHQIICVALDAIKNHRFEAVDWDEIEASIRNDNLNLYRTTRALWDRVQPIMAFCRLYGSDKTDSQATEITHDLIRRIQADWRLLFVGAPLSESDRAAGIEETVRLPQFLDIADLVAELTDDKWRPVLQVCLRNSLILRADYLVRLHKAGVDHGGAPELKLLQTHEIEELGDKDLVAYARSVTMQKESDLAFFDKAIDSWWKAMTESTHGNKVLAVANYTRFFEILRSLPHIVLVLSAKPFAASAESDIYLTPRNIFTCRRIWRHPQNELTLDCNFDISTGSYAYLRPRWNRSLKPHFLFKPGAGEILLETRLPEWMALFEKWASGGGAASPERFLRWCLQIPSVRRPAALRLLTRLIYFSQDQIRDLWRATYRNSLPIDAKTSGAVYLAPGHLGKSSTHLLYTLKQALTDLNESERGFDFRTAFRSVEMLRPDNNELRTLVFIDDFIGSGDQLVTYLEALKGTHPWLFSYRILIWTLAGFENGVTRLKDYLGAKSRIIVAHPLTEKDRAFSKENPLWDSETDRMRARTWSERVGSALLKSEGIDHPEENSLGWKDSQALVAFHHNIPNNTLPLFWGRGIVDERQWEPLFERF
jgi:hypothetical protein